MTSAVRSSPTSLSPSSGERGFFLDPHDPAFFEDPYPAYRAMRGLGPLPLWHDLGFPVAADYATVAALLRDRRFGRILPAGPDGRPAENDVSAHLSNFLALERHSLLDLEPPTHARLRGLVLRAFVSRQVERLEPRIAELADALIDRFASNGHVELVEAFATLLPVTVIAELVGLDPAAAPQLLDWSHRMVAMYQFGRTREQEEAADAAASDFADFVRAAIAEKRRRPADDLLSALIRAETAEGHLSEDEIVSTVVLLMNAGHEATVHQIGNGLRALFAANVEDAGARFADPAAGTTLVEEMLRFDTPLHLFRRVALDDVALANDVLIRRGEEVGLLLAAANRDPAAFADPDRFDPNRAGPAPLSFGGGIHFCVGARLARLELRVAFTALFRRLPDLHLVAEPRVRDTWHFRGIERLDLAFAPEASVRSE